MKCIEKHTATHILGRKSVHNVYFRETEYKSADNLNVKCFLVFKGTETELGLSYLMKLTQNRNRLTLFILIWKSLLSGSFLVLYYVPETHISDSFNSMFPVSLNDKAKQRMNGDSESSKEKSKQHKKNNGCIT